MKVEGHLLNQFCILLENRGFVLRNFVCYDEQVDGFSQFNSIKERLNAYNFFNNFRSDDFQCLLLSNEAFKSKEPNFYY